MAGIAIGTPSYMPPEQAAGRVFEIDARSDLFALGASCFRILAGRTVHPAESALAICSLMAKDPAPKLLTRGAERVAEDRGDGRSRARVQARGSFPDATAMRKAVDEAIADLGGDTIEIDSGMYEVEPPPPPPPSPPPPPPPPAREEKQEDQEDQEEVEVEKKKGGGLGWVFVLLLLVGGGVAAKIAWDRLQPTAPLGVVDAAGSATNVVVVDATVQAAVEDVHAEEVREAASEDAPVEASTDANVEDGAIDATADVSIDAPVDAETLDARSTSISAPDAGHHRRDGGVHHNVHHGHHH